MISSRPRESLYGRQLTVGNLPLHVGWQEIKDLMREAGNVVRVNIMAVAQPVSSLVSPVESPLSSSNNSHSNLPVSSIAHASSGSREHAIVLFATAKDAAMAIGMHSGIGFQSEFSGAYLDRFSGYVWHGCKLDVHIDESLSGINSAHGVGGGGGGGAASTMHAQNMAANTLDLLHTPLPGFTGRKQVFVSNLPFVVGWQDLKDLFREAGNITRADIKNETRSGRNRGHGTVLFTAPQEAEMAIKMFDGFEWFGRRIEVREDRTFRDRETLDSVGSPGSRETASPAMARTGKGNTRNVVMTPVKISSPQVLPQQAPSSPQVHPQHVSNNNRLSYAMKVQMHANQAMAAPTEREQDFPEEEPERASTEETFLADSLTSLSLIHADLPIAEPQSRNRSSSVSSFPLSTTKIHRDTVTTQGTQVPGTATLEQRPTSRSFSVSQCSRPLPIGQRHSAKTTRMDTCGSTSGAFFGLHGSSGAAAAGGFVTGSLPNNFFLGSSFSGPCATSSHACPPTAGNHSGGLGTGAAGLWTTSLFSNQGAETASGCASSEHVWSRSNSSGSGCCSLNGSGHIPTRNSNNNHHLAELESLWRRQ